MAIFILSSLSDLLRLLDNSWTFS